jgi:hypothetical protein
MTFTRDEFRRPQIRKFEEQHVEPLVLNKRALMAARVSSKKRKTTNRTKREHRQFVPFRGDIPGPSPRAFRPPSIVFLNWSCPQA